MLSAFTPTRAVFHRTASILCHVSLSFRRPPPAVGRFLTTRALRRETMSQIIECVPNFSEGIRQDVIDAISKSIKSVSGVTLLDVDPGKSTNRTVYTFVGTGERVVEAALAAAKTAHGLIDMTHHFGEHPRLGALDVCPFIPVKNATMDDCVACAQEFSRRLGDELKVPVYLYGFASQREYRKTVPQIRAGEYEGLAEKIKKEEWVPDYGPAKFVPSWGATIAGARKFLAAYNINLLSTKEQAHRLALNIREQGRGPKEPGRLKCLQALGWWYEEGKIAQISTNLTDLDVTTIHEVFEAASEDAKELSLPVIGSELVGLVPLKPILQAAEHFIKKENLFILEEEQKVQLTAALQESARSKGECFPVAVNRLGLNTLSRFDYKTRIIEYAVDSSKTESPLIHLTVKAFVQEVAARKAAPGGGSVSALIGSMGAGLCRMVGLLTSGNKKFEHLEGDMRRVVPVFHDAMHKLLPLVDLDTKAFNSIIDAHRMPSNTSEEKSVKEAALQKATRAAIAVPLETAQAANSTWNALVELCRVGNITAISDLQVGGKCLEAAVAGAVWNVHINLAGLDDAEEREKLNRLADNALSTAQEGFAAVCRIVEERKRDNK